MKLNEYLSMWGMSQNQFARLSEEVQPPGVSQTTVSKICRSEEKGQPPEISASTARRIVETSGGEVALDDLIVMGVSG